MHRRAHGGAWSAAVLMIGCCSPGFAAEPRLASGYSSGGYSSGAATTGSIGTSKVSTFVPHSSSPAPAATISPGAVSAPPSSTFGGMTPVGSNSAAGARAIEIVPTPFVPYASVLAQQGRVFSPASVANVPSATPMVTPNSLGVPTSPGWIPRDTSRANWSSSPLTELPLATSPITTPPATTSAPLVPVILPAAEKALLDQALGAAKVPSPVEAKAAPIAKTTEEPVVAEVGPVSKPVELPAKTIPPVAEEVAVASPAKISPLPPLEREVPSPPPPTMNLPQPPIPLEYPRTGR